MATDTTKRVRVGIIGAGEVAQVIHLPTLALHHHLFEVLAICDISAQTALHCATKFHIPTHTTSSSVLISNPSIDIIFILAADEYHESLCISALRAGKKVFIEKPITLSLPSLKRILEAEKEAGGNKVFVGYMRRYAPSFTNVFLKEVASIPRILYARSRDIIGPNPYFIGQSGTNPVKFTDFPAGSGEERGELGKKLVSEAYGGGEVTEEETTYCRFLGGLGSHDLSLMREAIGSPESVVAVSANENVFYTAMFAYRNQTAGGEPFTVTYESGIDSVPRFDAHLAVYGAKKSVSIQYDTPYVKGLPIVVKVEETGENGERVYREVMSSYEDAYTVQLKNVWGWVVEGGDVKTSAADAEGDVRLFGLMMERLRKQREGL